LLGKLQKKHNITLKGKTIKWTDCTHIEKGNIIAYISDTQYFTGLIPLSKEADVLISESTYASELEEKAKNYLHMTAAQAATVAKKAEAKKLVLTHFSSRYNNTKILLEEARKIFPNTITAHDFLTLSL
jgi:ribonuclease Z